MASSMVEMTLWTPAKEVITIDCNGKSAEVVLEGEQSLRFIVPKEYESEIGQFFEEVAHYRLRFNRYEFKSQDEMKKAVAWIAEQYKLV